MSDPIALASSTPALGLPLLFAGQAQKEFFVNEALCLLDALHARAVTASQPAPPASAVEGACYRVTSTATGAWAGQEGRLAVHIAGAWHFVAPVEGMVVFDRTRGDFVIFRSQWQPAAEVAVPAGGTVIDVQARGALTALITALRTVGVLAAPNP
ncbi:MAG: DUF2793 domain-containing protein [Erythrobacter sp.]|uniref:DUF2793 domain-containing protein n=1 Tax=Erythrobacter sp. TaxID=1042 RepID=UPI0025EB0A7C|nr:DUF2793 domain-containing protein [Erythrobacter sp.]MCM0001038.1 DUF2793 domain-containing protein [Erythrobacter sp.]